MDMVNFAVFHQPKEDIQTLQQQQKAYYFSAAFNVVLEKHGLLSIRCQTPDVGNAAPGFVCREMSLPPDLLSCPLVMEGPLHEATLRALGVQATQKSTHQLQITGQDLETIQILGYSQFTVRKIPRERQAAQAPFPFVSEDDLWNRDRFYYQILSVPDGWEAVLMAVSETEPTPVPVAITNGQHLVLGIPLFDILTVQHGFPPLEDAGYYEMTRYSDTYDIENWLLQAAIRLFTQHNFPVVRAQNWPVGYESAFSVRHDFDRPISMDAIASILDFYRQFNVRSTWFWLQKTFNKQQIDYVRTASHEVALHSIAPDEAVFKAEIDFFKDAGHILMEGITAHGGTPSYGYLGLNQHEWCENAGWLYGEMLGKNNVLPHSAITLSENIPSKANLVLPVVHQSLDAGVKPEAHYADYLHQALPKTLAQGAHCVLMNHPDIHIQELKELIKTLPLEKTWNATFSEVCEWVRTFKLTSEVIYQDDRINVTFETPLTQESAIEVITSSSSYIYTLPKGTISTHINPTQSESMTLELDQPLQHYFDDIRDIICRSYESQGVPVSSATATLKHNTDVLFRRAKHIEEAITPIQNGLCAELGCGYGFLALAIHKHLKMKVIGYDCNPSFLELGDELLKRHPHLERGLSFEELNYAEQPLPSATFDLITLYGTFHYLVGTEKQTYALKSAYDALKPDGQICIQLPNYWHPIEPFTKLWFVHWLPRQLSDKVATRMGKRTLLDIEHQSPVHLSQMMKAVGFKNINYLPLGKFSDLPKPLTYIACNTYIISAKK